MDKIKYVNGFLFSPNQKKVVLLRKNRPTWQCNMLNGVGGKVDVNESTEEAMIREFEEEAGLRVENWKEFLTLSGETWEVYFYHSIAENYDKVYSKTDEQIEIHYTFNIFELEIIPNLKWIIPMAMDPNHLYSSTQSI